MGIESLHGRFLDTNPYLHGDGYGFDSPLCGNARCVNGLGVQQTAVSRRRLRFAVSRKRQ